MDFALVEYLNQGSNKVKWLAREEVKFLNDFISEITNVAEISEEGRSLSAVMLRRLFSNEFEEFFGKVSWIFK